MAKLRSTEGEKVDKKTRVKWTFPRATLEQALKLVNAIKEKNGGNPWEPEEVRKAIGAGTGGNAYFYLTAASREPSPPRRLRSLIWAAILRMHQIQRSSKA